MQAWFRSIGRTAAPVFCGLVILLAAGCEEPTIKKYSAPAEKSDVSSSRLADYKLPEGWTRLPKAVEFSVATFQVADGNILVTLSRFPGDAGGLPANIARWRGKLGLKDEPGPNKNGVQELKADGQPVSYVDLTGALQSDDVKNGLRKDSPSRILGAIVRPANSSVTWVLKMQGTPEAVGRHKAEFEAFVQSMKFGMGAYDG
jgi:hypothetical protein